MNLNYGEYGIRGKLFRNDAIEEFFPDDNVNETFTKAHHIIAGYILEMIEDKRYES